MVPFNWFLLNSDSFHQPFEHYTLGTENRIVMIQKKVLRIRPFNMANFSGAGGYIPMVAILGTLVAFPATLLLWTGFALPMKTESGDLDYSVLKRRLTRVLLPLYCLSLVPWFSIVIHQTSFYGGSVFGFLVYAASIAAIHFGGIFISIYYPAKRQSHFPSFSKGKWFSFTVLYALLMVVVAFFASFFLAILGG